MTNILEDVKIALRISHSALDVEINDNIEACKADMIRAGIVADKVDECCDPLIARAVKTYCQAFFVDDTNKAEKYMESYKYQLDNIRKTPSYMGVE